MERIAVIGGGISGLSAALTLVDSGRFRVDLFEASNRLGGVLETIKDQGYLIERSADNFSTLIPDARDLSTQLGLDGSLIHPNPHGRRAYVLVDGRIHPIPSGFSLMQPTRLGSILSSGALTWPGKLRLLGEYWTPARRDRSDESLESFATRRLGREAFERLVEPIVSGIFTANPATLSMEATLPQFLEMERSAGGLIRGYLASRKQNAAAAARRASGARYDQFVAPRDGMSSWIEGLSRHLPDDSVHLGAKILQLNSSSDSSGKACWTIELASTRESEESDSVRKMQFDAVIVATPAPVTANLLKNVSEKAAEIVGGISYASSAVAAMVLPRADAGAAAQGFGLVVPRREKRPSLAISFSSNKYSGRVPEDQILLRLFLGGALQPEIVDLPDGELLRIAHQELKDILGIARVEPRWQQIIRWKESMPQYLVGHVQRISRLEQLLSESPTVQLCGAAYAGVGIPQCVRSGRRAAQNLIDYFSNRGQIHSEPAE